MPKTLPVTRPETKSATGPGLAGVVIDMCHLTLFDTSVEVKADGQTSNPISLTGKASRRMIRALRKGSRAKLAKIPMKLQLGGKDAVIEYSVVELKETQDPSQSRKVDKEYTIKLERADGSGRQTQVVLTFQKDHPESPKRFWIGIQGNPTSLFSGQNIAPAEPVIRSARNHLGMMFSWQALFVVAACKAADPDFQAPASLMRKIEGGQAVFQNMQFAIDLPIRDSRQPLSIAMIKEVYGSSRFVTRDGEWDQYELGDQLHVRAKIYRGERGGGRPENESVQLIKIKGEHQFASVLFYNKATKEKLSPDDAKAAGLIDRLRADITLKKPGLLVMLVEAQALAKKHGEALELDRNKSAGRLKLTQRNCTDACAIIDHRYVSQRHAGSRGFAAWLIDRILCEEFHLEEVFGFSPERWQNVVDVFKRRAARNPRYGKAFKAWSKADIGKKTLREFLIDAGFSDDTARRRVAELEAFGFSGRIPPSFWLNIEVLTMLWGATNKEYSRYKRRVKAGQPVVKLLAQLERRSKPVIRGMGRAVARAHELPALPSVPFAGRLTSIGATPKPALLPAPNSSSVKYRKMRKLAKAKRKAA